MTVATFESGTRAVLAVSSDGDPIGTTPAPMSDETRGFGLPIVRWIAEQHRGELTYNRSGTLNTFALTLPLLSASRGESS